MKKMFDRFTAVCLAWAATSLLNARAGESRPYLTLEAGPTFAEDVTLHDFVGVSSGNRVEFDPGFRFGVGGGYSFNDIVAIGGETGVSYNSFDRISGNFFGEGDSGVGNMPLLANIVFKLPNKTGLVPFVGGGAGVSFTFFSADELVFDPTPAAGDETIVDGSDSDAVFAWQLFGGLKFRLDERMSLGVAYKYLRTEAPVWEADEDTFPSGLSNEIRLSGMATHSVAFVFSMKF